MADFHKRTGPRPLWLHLNAGAAMMACASDGAGMLQASQTILLEALEGVKAYHNSDVRPFKRKMFEVANVCGSKIISASEWYDPHKPAVLLIPSLINGYEIFDIEKDFSFANFLSEQGFMPLILEWVEPDMNISFDEYCTHHAVVLIENVLKVGIKLHGLIGYCMGATMIPVLYKIAPDLMQNIAKNILIAPPWDFSYLSFDQNVRINSLSIQMNVFDKIIPVDFVQSLFWAIDPLQVIKKFRKFPNIDNPDRFVRVEDWLNNGRVVSKAVLETCLYDWYRDNNITKGIWDVSGHKIDAKSIHSEVMIVCGQKDNLVPFSSVQALRNEVKNHEYISVETGHIGLMASDKSRNAAWMPVADFLKKAIV